MVWYGTAASFAAEAALSPGATAVACHRTFSCVVRRGASASSCPDSIGGSRLFRDQPLIILSLSDQKATIAGGATYELEIRGQAYRLSRHKLLSFAVIDWESVIDRLSGALSGQTTIQFRGEAKVIEFHFIGNCVPVVSGIPD